MDKAMAKLEIQRAISKARECMSDAEIAEILKRALSVLFND